MAALRAAPRKPFPRAELFAYEKAYAALFEVNQQEWDAWCTATYRDRVSPRPLGKAGRSERIVESRRRGAT